MKPDFESNQCYATVQYTVQASTCIIVYMNYLL